MAPGESREDLVGFLRESLDDHRLSRAESKVLDTLLKEQRPAFREQRVLIAKAFDLVRSELADPADVSLLSWLQDVVRRVVSARAIGADGQGTNGELAEAWFLPSAAAVQRLISLIAACRETLDVCVFTITNDELSGALLAAHERGVGLRIITDDDKASDRGSDIDRLRSAGVDVRTDSSDAHMHHKFALFDGRKLLTGSYNWTRSASRENQENFLVSDDPRLVSRYKRAFDDLWRSFR